MGLGSVLSRNLARRSLFQALQQLLRRSTDIVRVITHFPGLTLIAMLNPTSAFYNAKIAARRTNSVVTLTKHADHLPLPMAPQKPRNFRIVNGPFPAAKCFHLALSLSVDVATSRGCCVANAQAPEFTQGLDATIFKKFILVDIE
jgi:hypothetical protein